MNCAVMPYQRNGRRARVADLPPGARRRLPAAGKPRRNPEILLTVSCKMGIISATDGAVFEPRPPPQLHIVRMTRPGDTVRHPRTCGAEGAARTLRQGGSVSDETLESEGDRADAAAEPVRGAPAHRRGNPPGRAENLSGQITEARFISHG